LYVLDDATVSRIKECKNHGFPICLQESFSEIFREASGQILIEQIVAKLPLREGSITSASQIWMIYDQVLEDLAKALGKDVSEVIRFQSLRKMESMKGCTLCPLYQREISKRQEE